MTKIADAIDTAPSPSVMKAIRFRGRAQPEARKHDHQPEHQYRIERNGDGAVRLFDQLPALLRQALEVVEAVRRRACGACVLWLETAEFQLDVFSMPPRAELSRPECFGNLVADGDSSRLGAEARRARCWRLRPRCSCAAVCGAVSVSGPYSRIVRSSWISSIPRPRTDVLVPSSKRFLTEVVSRPSTSAANVTSIVLTSATSWDVSRFQCRSDSKGRTSRPTALLPSRIPSSTAAVASSFNPGTFI